MISMSGNLVITIHCSFNLLNVEICLERDLF